MPFGVGGACRSPQWKMTLQHSQSVTSWHGKARKLSMAREKWWIGLRSADLEHYSAAEGDFSRDEEFYRLGFEAALHARNRCKEYDQVLAEMQADLEDLKRRYP